MALDWPSSPSIGALYPSIVAPGSPQWQWNGEGWAKYINAGQVVSVLLRVGPVVERNLLPFPADFGMDQWDHITYI